MTVLVLKKVSAGGEVIHSMHREGEKEFLSIFYAEHKVCVRTQKKSFSDTLHFVGQRVLIDSYSVNLFLSTQKIGGAEQLVTL